ncbi:Lrp/AsnC family transcriptional regulator, partial [Candidatus Bathyarchaeota archaeon]|nr:Lrp/AsnC family transcriptional regulator [Candidatus Bathyarchaeota archaeon]
VKVHVHIDRGALGLARYVMLCDFKDDLEEVADKLLDRLARENYIEFFARLIPWGGFLVLASLPPRFETKYRIFLDRLIDMGILRGYQMFRVNWLRYFSMRVDCFDFKRYCWKFQWDDLSNRDASTIVSIEEDVRKARIDKLDLRIIGMLQKDSSLSVAEIARQLDVDYKKVLYHFKEHIVGGGLIKGYILRWHGEVKSKNSLTRMIMVLDGLEHSELEAVKEVFQDIPFTWFDSYSRDSGVYMAYLVVPVEHLQGTLKYTWRRLSNTRRKLIYAFIDSECSRAYMVPMEPFVEEIGWTFSIKTSINLLSEILNLNLAR